MKVVLSKVYTKKVKPLEHICMMKCPLDQDESTLRRYLMPVQMVIRGFCYKETSPLSGQGHAQHFLNILKDTNMYDKFGTHISKHFRETIYMHQFYM